MSRLRFDGNLCGLHGATQSGDVNDPVNHMLVCSCGVDLGPLRRFLAFRGDGLGRKIVKCGHCLMLTILSETGEILKVGSQDELRVVLEAKRLNEAARKAG